MKINPTRATRLKEASKKRREAQKADLRQAILEAGAKLFEEKGYEGFSLRQVAEEVGYTPTTIYLYFKDKDDLLLHVVYDGFKQFGEYLQRAYDKGKTPLERLHTVGWAYFDFAMSHPVHYRLMFMQRGEFLQKPPEGASPVIDSFGILEQVIRESIANKIFRKGDVKTTAALIWANVHGVVSLALVNQFNSEQTKHLFEQQMAATERAYCVH
jgi:AcrR family transcriptional regulator